MSEINKGYEVVHEVIEGLILPNTSEQYRTHLLLNSNNKKIFGRKLPELRGSFFTYTRPNKYTFGCSAGAFDYVSLLKTIAEAKAASITTITYNSIKKTGAKVSSTVKSNIQETTNKYYILGNGKAYLKSDYEPSTYVSNKANPSFGGFTYSNRGWEGSGYFYKGYYAGSRETILETMQTAKEIIDFIEAKGNYAPIVEEVESTKKVKSSKVV